MSQLQHYTGDDWVDPLNDYEPREYTDPLEEALAEETVAAIRSKPYAEISPDKTIHAAIQALSGLKVASLLVVEEGRLVGVFTERDVLERVSTRIDDVRELPVREVMTANPIVVYETDPAATALSAIAAAGYRRVPVLDINDEVVGVISPRRVISFLQERFSCE
ncbi:MAG: CBS domain-containing protein [Planctomycetes bacterium]|nr:CBS domain-containing protein [Planctomycetota bacterium]MBL7042378.1 CBS domain-containing protein [Pirellulaceae bacterium]